MSAGEIHRAIAAGFKPGQQSHPPEIVFTADIFDREALDLVVKHDIHVNCGSPDMIDQYGEAASRPARPAARSRSASTPASATATARRPTPAAATRSTASGTTQLADCVARAAKHNLTIAGLHMHIGSGSDMEHLSQVCGAMEKAAREVGPSITSISAGGGLPIDYREGDELVDIGAYFELWNATRAAAGRANSATRSRSRSSRAATSSPRAATSSPRSAP